MTKTARTSSKSEPHWIFGVLPAGEPHELDGRQCLGNGLAQVVRATPAGPVTITVTCRRCRGRGCIL